MPIDPRKRKNLSRLTTTLALLAIASPGFSSALISIDREPINYYGAAVNDPVARLQARLDSGEAQLEYDEERGYLASVLENLDIPFSSQGLVFSKTSFQLRRIDPKHPRAVYFNDDTYIGWVQDGDVVEVSSVDPNQGAIFYALEQKKVDKPRFVRQTDECLQCHSSPMTRGVPGHVVRSVFTAPDGQPVLNAGTFRTDHTSPFSERWGGWYVSGTHGTARHMGNTLLAGGSDPEALDREEGANLTDLSERINVEPYLSPTSDLVALMVLEHQTTLHNLITTANYQGRLAIQLQEELNEMDGKPKNFIGGSAIRRFGYATEPLLKYMLYIEEATLESPIEGVSEFANDFMAKGKRDSRGRSLRDLDLETRMFKYPCSYLIYSDAFNALLPALRDHFLTRIWEVLSGEDKSGDYDRLTPEDRNAVREILLETLDDLPECWG